MTPIFVRPVREQLEHDRLIRFLQTRYKRKFEVAIHPGDAQTMSVRIGAVTLFPDLVLMDGKRLGGLVEVETAESTNNLEAMAQWTHFSRARVPFHLYVPVLAVDATRRLCEANQVAVAEIWTYRAVNDQFDLVRVHHDANAVKMGTRLGPKTAPVVKPIVKAAPAPEPPPAPEPEKSKGKGVAALVKTTALPVGKGKAVVPAPVAKEGAATTGPSAKASPAVPVPKAGTTPAAKPAAKPVAAKKPAATKKSAAKPAPTKKAAKTVRRPAKPAKNKRK